MGKLNYDPNGVPETPEGCLDRMASSGGFIAHVICTGERDTPGNFTGVSFTSHFYTMPRKEDILELERGDIVEVTDILHKQVVEKDENGEIVCISFVPNIIATRIG